MGLKNMKVCLILTSYQKILFIVCWTTITH